MIFAGIHTGTGSRSGKTQRTEPGITEKAGLLFVTFIKNELIA